MTPRFVHHYVHSLDPKRRLTIPSGFRDQLVAVKGFYVLPGVPEKCLYMYTPEAFETKWEKMRQAAAQDRRIRRFVSNLGARSDFVTWDGQGRIRIKDDLLSYAEITDQVVLVGAIEMIELWNPRHWEAGDPLNDKSLQEAAEYVGFF
jgi:MraZ protein